MDKQEPKTFIKRMLNNRFKKCISTLLKKEIEYASEKNRFHNFIEGAKLMDSLQYKVTPMDCLRFYQSKHLASIIDHIKGKGITQKLIDEKIGDLFNYHILALGLLWEENDLSLVIAQQSALLNTNLSVKQIITNSKEEEYVHGLLTSLVGNWKSSLIVGPKSYEEQCTLTQYMLFDTVACEYYLREELWKEKENQIKEKSMN